MWVSFYPLLKKPFCDFVFYFQDCLGSLFSPDLICRRGGGELCVCVVCMFGYHNNEILLTSSQHPIVLWHMDLFAPIGFTFSLLSFHGEGGSSAYVLTERRMESFKSSGGLCSENKNPTKRGTVMIDGNSVFLPGFPCRNPANLATRTESSVRQA